MNKSHYIIPIFVPHEGCPHNCVFCNQNSITGSHETITGSHEVIDGRYVRDTVEKYLETINKNNSIIEISFFGGTFTAINIEKQKELLGVAKKYKDKGLINYIRLSTRPDYIDEAILNNLKQYSVDIIELGVQSLDNDVLLKSGRGHTCDDVYKATTLIKNYGFILGHQIMLGLPGDTFEKDIETTRKIIDMGPSICRIYPSLVIKNTPMEKMYVNNIYTPYTLQEAVEIAKTVYSMLVANGINVIRVGLQPTEEINVNGEIVSGPFHPAFRELVEGSIMNDIILKEVIASRAESVLIRVNSKDISKLYADKKSFFYDMKKQLETVIVKVTQDNDINRGSIAIEYDEKVIKLSLFECVTKMYKEGKITPHIEYSE